MTYFMDIGRSFVAFSNSNVIFITILVFARFVGRSLYTCHTSMSSYSDPCSTQLSRESVTNSHLHLFYKKSHIITIVFYLKKNTHRLLKNFINL